MQFRACNLLDSLRHLSLRMQTQKKSKHIGQRILKGTLKVVLFLLAFIILLFLLILTPPVQRFATTRVETYLEKKLKTKVQIGAISIGLPRKVVLENIYIEDQAKDTLLSGESIKADITLLKLLSSEVEINELTLNNITAKVTRVLPDTAFNFQFIVDAFITEKTAVPDTAAAAPLKLAISKLELDNFRVVYKDVITGNDMFANLKNLRAEIDSIDLTGLHFNVPSLKVDGLVTNIQQTKPLVDGILETPDSSTNAVTATAPVMDLDFGVVDLTNIHVNYGNEVSAFFTQFNIGQLRVDGKDMDLANQSVHLQKIKLANAASVIRLGKKVQAKLVQKEVEQEVKEQVQQPWKIRIDEIEIDNNSLAFDNDNTPAQDYGIDFAHMRGDSLTLHLKNLVMNPDSMAASVTRGSFREKSGFILTALEGDLLYAYNQAYLKNLLIRTPGTELKRNAVLEYASFDALAKNFEQTVFDFDITNSYVQVKDILAFAPQLRFQPAFSNPSDIWHFNLVGNGTMNRLNIESLQFDGFKNTQVDASGVLAGLTNPNEAGGTFTIRRLHTSQSDIASFTGQRLSNAQMNLPETFLVAGTLSGNIANLATNLNLSTSSGNVSMNGRFANLTNPTRARYAATLTTRSLQVGRIIRNNAIGALTTTFTVNGTGFTPEAMNAVFKGAVQNVGYDGYTYRNINLIGSLRQSIFNVTTDIRDPNINLTATASGNMATASSFKLDAFVDSIKTFPLGFTPQPLVFRGKIDADIASANPDNLVANLLVSKALLVANGERIPIDSIQLESGRNANGNFIMVQSDFISARLEGQYQLAELGAIIQHNLQPYFAISPTPVNGKLQPYNFSFRADVANSPFLSAFMPGLQINEPIHAEGTIAEGQGIQASVTSPALVFGPTQITGLSMNVATTNAGLKLTGNVGQLKNGNAFHIYNTQINATALNNIIDFSLGVDDRNNRDKYFIGGVFSQPAAGTYSFRLKPDSLLLNYDRWTVSANNEIKVSPSAIFANQFILQKAGQQLSLQSGTGSGAQPLTLQFTNFQLATLTGFLKSDSLLAGGSLNGAVTFQNLMQQPLFTSNLTISDLSLKQDTIGNINLQVNNTAENRYNINTTLTGRGNDIQVTGSLTPQAKDIAMDIDVAVRSLQLSTMEGALATALYNASGTITGNVAVNGTTAAPDVVGELNFNGAKFNTVFLGGDFTIDNEKLRVTDDGFVFDSFSIRDSANNALTLNGTVLTPNFINYNFDLNVNATNFRALNTQKKNNSIYYGQLYLSTAMHIDGTETSPVIDGTVSINKGTNLSIVVPQAEPGVAQREGVVEFVDMDAPGNDSLFLAYDSLNASALVGFDIAANIEINKEAILNVVIDEANGDFLNVRGEGLLTAGIDQSGKVTLTGSYQMEEGAYELSFNLLRRRFEIEKGSKIVWLGEPTQADLDVTAVYVANTSALDLVQDQISESNTTLRTRYLQKLPFEVHLSLGGELMKPNISFDIILPEGNRSVGKDITEQIDTRLAQIRQEPSELNKQVFALLLMNRFVGENPFQSSAGGGGFNASNLARQSVSKLLTEQLNSLAGNLIGGVELTFDVASTDDYTTGERATRTDLNVGLSKRLLSDRLTVTVGSNFELEGPQRSGGGNQQGGNSMIGNVNVNYLLSKDGRYRLRAYQKNEYQGQVDGYVIETGLGFSITMDYNQFRELFVRRRSRTADGNNSQKKTE